MKFIISLLELTFYITAILGILKYLGLPSNYFSFWHKEVEQDGYDDEELYKGFSNSDAPEAEAIANLYKSDKTLFTPEHFSPEGIFTSDVDIDNFSTLLYSGDTGVEET